MLNNKSRIEWNESEIATLAHQFCVSREVVLRRMLIIGLTNESFYMRKRKEYNEEYRQRKLAEAESQDDKQSGFAPHYRMVIRRNGKSFTRLVFDAYNQENITLSDVADYLDVKINHLLNIEQTVFASA